ncbi:MAG: glycosyltransferase [Thermodesulfobacteriota bacterium]
MPKVTVLMTVYNGEKFLKEAIDAVLSQTFRDFEFLIINDGSTDGSREIIESYKDPRINLVDNERNIGLTASLNRGLRLAGGEYIARQDADDVSLPERLEKQISILERDRETTLIGSWYLEIDESGNPLREYKLPCEPLQIRWDSIFYCSFSTVVFRRERVLNNVGFYDESFRYAQDWELYSKIARTHTVVNVGECLVKYRLHSRSMTDTYGSVVQSEIDKIRAMNVGYYTGSDTSGKIEDYYRKAGNMHSMLFMDGKNLRYEDLDATAGEIVRLHSAFSAKHGLGKKQSGAHLAKIYLKIAGVYASRHDISGTARYIARACGTDRTILFSNITLSIISKCLASRFKYHAGFVWTKVPVTIRSRIRKRRL